MAMEGVWPDVERVVAGIERMGRSNQLSNPHQTGSINRAAMGALYALSTWCAPKVIVEVGTYSGRSGMALLEGAPGAMLHTCDRSTETVDFGRLSANVRFYPKTEAAGMFTELGERGIKADLVFLDGRLSAEDIKALVPVLKADTVIAVDDFEGLEKGVCNMQALRPAHLIYPPAGCTIAVGLPKDSVRLTRQ